MNTVNASKNAGGRSSSMDPTSLENLFKIRPVIINKRFKYYLGYNYISMFSF